MRTGLLIIVLLYFISVQKTYSEDSLSITANEFKEITGRGIATSWLKKDKFKFNYTALKAIKEKGFKNVRIRTNAQVYTGSRIDELEQVVDACIEEDIIAIISWINHNAEERANETDKVNYVNWWTEVARTMKGKSFNLAFNLFTEIGNNPLRNDINKYNDWTRRAVDSIRSIDPQRIIILSAPAKKSSSLINIASDIYTGDNYMLAEWHLYASGPNKGGGQKNWEGTGSSSDRANLISVVDIALNFTKNSGIPTYFGAWMPWDNINNSLSDDETMHFCKFFIETLEIKGIPWSVNALNHFYDEDQNEWTGPRSFLVDTLVMYYINGKPVTPSDTNTQGTSLTYYSKVNSNEFLVRPNFVTENIQIQISDVKFKEEGNLVFYNTVGLVAKTIKLKDNNSVIRIGDLQPGIYFLILSVNDNIYSQRIIIK